MQSNPYRRIHTQQPIQMHSNAKIKVLELREDFQQWMNQKEKLSNLKSQ